ncbi:MAG: HD-GYP domain-containing protein [Actinomycetota bacterium]
MSVVRYDGSWLTLLALLALFAVVDRFRSRTTAKDEITVSVSFIVGLAAIVVTGPYGGCLVALLGGVLNNDRDWPRRIFNPAQYAIATLTAGVAYSVYGVSGAGLAASPLWRSVIATTLAALTHYVVSHALIAGIVSLTTGLSVPRVWASSFSWMGLSYCGYGLLGLLMAVLWTDLGVVAAFVLMLPLLIARAAFANYAEQRAAYDATVRALVQAVETKDYYTRGHSERVSKIAERIAREAGMREDRVEIARYAGMLHDVGKMGVPTKTLQKQGKLSGPEFDEIKLHPLRGYEMLCEIDFLREALTGVYHHHERLDGRGYPMGLEGDEIPEFARVIMVADAFDSMTSTRSYRFAKSVDEAIAELRRCQDIQFDAKVVDCLVESVRKHGWEPTPEEFTGEQVARDSSPLNREATGGSRRAGT